MKEQTYANHCIVCNVTSCQNHHRDKNYCTLEAIRVGTHEKDPSHFIPRTGQAPHVSVLSLLFVRQHGLPRIKNRCTSCCIYVIIGSDRKSILE